MINRLLVTPGEPAGIGPDLCLSLLNIDIDDFEIAVVMDPDVLKQRAAQLGSELKIQLIDSDTPVAPSQIDTIKVIPVKTKVPVIAGTPNPDNSKYVLQCLDLAVDACLSKTASALITGPINKATINEAGIAFTGHTEYLQQRCHVEQVVMMLATHDLKVALATTHLPLRQVPDAITPELLDRVFTVLTKSLKDDFGLNQAKTLIAGLNPHAGENGYLGREEIDIIEPVIKKWQANGYNLIGPLPADTLYAQHSLKNADATLAMYHDQGLPVLKHSGFGKAVNITLGLPIIRTSVDHGTALELAGTGECHAGSFLQAIKFAAQMAHNRFKNSTKQDGY